MAERLDVQFPFDGVVRSELRALVAQLESRFTAVEGDRASLTDAIASFEQVAITRINEAVQPALDALVETAQLGILFTANSTSSRKSLVGTQTWVVSADDRDRFCPAGTVAIISDDPTVWMSGETVSYNRMTGDLVVAATNAYGTEAPNKSSWLILPATPYQPANMDPGTFDSPTPGATPAKALRTNVAGDTPIAAKVPAGVLGFNFADGRVIWKSPEGLVKSSPALTDVAVSADIQGALSAVSDEKNARITADAKGVRVDVAQSFQAAEGFRARLNLGKPAFVTISQNTNLTTNGLDSEYAITGAYTLRAPAAETVKNGFRTGLIEHRDDQSTATIRVAAGDKLNGTVDGSMPLAYRQTGYLVYDGDGWRWRWIERKPTLALLNISDNTAAIELWTAGYQMFELRLANFQGNSAGLVFGFRVSSDGVTYKSGLTDYFYRYDGASSNVDNNSAAPIILSSSTTPLYSTSGAPIATGVIDLRYGNYLGSMGYINTGGSPSNLNFTIRSTQNYQGTVITSPQRIALVAIGGSIARLNGEIVGIPSA